MKNVAAVRERFESDPERVQLGSLASALARLRSFATDDRLEKAARLALEESRLMAEWMKSESDGDTHRLLATIRAQLVDWEADWPTLWASSTRRVSTAQTVEQWSMELLDISGLIPRGA